MSEAREIAKKAVEALGLTYKATFVPLSQSRNANTKHDGRKVYSLNWKIAISKGNQPPLVTDYGQGVAHVPGYYEAQKKLGPRSQDFFNYYTNACETGTIVEFNRGKKIPPPALEDIMYCLLMDADVFDHANYESWASDLGYATRTKEGLDGRHIYDECLRIALQLRAMLGDATIQQLKEAFQDF